MLLFHDIFVGPVIRMQKTVTRRSKPEWKFRQFKVGSVHQAEIDAMMDAERAAAKEVA